METHYVCTGGCGAESPKTGACSDEACLMYNMDFTECACEDSEHREVMRANPDDMEEDDWEDDDDVEEIELDEDELGEWEKKLNGGGDEEDEDGEPEEERWN